MKIEMDICSRSIVRVFIFGVAAIFAVAPALAQSPTGELFSWDADSTQIIVKGGTSSCLSLKGGSIIDRNEKHRGVGSLKHVLGDAQHDLGCDPGAMAPGGDIFDGGETYFRWWMKIDSSMDWGDAQKKAKFARLTRSNEKNPGYTTMYLFDRGFRWAGAFNPTGSDRYVNLDVDFDPSDGACRSSKLVQNIGADCTEWREYIFYFKRNTCPNCENGVARFYVNGQLVDESNNISFAEFVPADGVTTFKYAWAGIGGKIFPQMCANGNTCGTGGIIWIDDISISTEWNSLEYAQEVGPRPGSPKPLVPEKP